MEEEEDRWRWFLNGYRHLNSVENISELKKSNHFLFCQLKPRRKKRLLSRGWSFVVRDWERLSSRQAIGLFTSSEDSPIMPRPNILQFKSLKTIFEIRRSTDFQPLNLWNARSGFLGWMGENKTHRGLNCFAHSFSLSLFLLSPLGQFNL